MQIIVRTTDPIVTEVDVLVIPMFADEKKFPSTFIKLDATLYGGLRSVIAVERFEKKSGETKFIRTSGHASVKNILLVGASGKKLTSAEARKIAALMVKKARECKAKTVALALTDHLAESITTIAKALTEGAILGDYRYLKYKDEDCKKYTDEAVETVTILLAKGQKVAAAEKGIQLGMCYSRGTLFTRALVNEPASSMTPTHLVAVARALAEAHPKKISLKIFDRDQMEKMRMGGVLAVARGSDEPPYTIHLTYTPKTKAKKRVVLVGKGITFDSGGLSLKPAEHMEDMKIDMAGCAAVLGVFSVLADLAPDVEVHGIAAICENMPSGKAVKPGDIVRTMSGKTIEILNTDAEGRVTLADTLWYGQTFAPDAMIDLATLTGACMVALGHECAGLMSNTPKLAQALLVAAAKEGEQLWELPLVDEYRELVKSAVADLKNIGGKYAGAITAGLFLEEFVNKKQWAHLDIAGPAYAEKESIAHQPLGATGYAVRTLLEFIMSFR